MTTATDRGFEIGKLYRVINDENSSYYKKGMVVKFIRDDKSNCPLFEFISGEPGCAVQDGYYYIDLCDLEPVESTGVSKSNSTKPLLLLYIQQQYPDDKVLKALVESL
jgi:hypothetical protein